MSLEKATTRYLAASIPRAGRTLRPALARTTHRGDPVTHTLSPAEWQARIPWQTKARVITALDKRIREQETELAALGARLDAARHTVALLDVHETARAYLAARGMDPEGPSRLDLLLREVDRAAAVRRAKALRDTHRRSA